MAIINTCPGCGKNVALVGKVHRNCPDPGWQARQRQKEAEDEVAKIDPLQRPGIAKARKSRKQQDEAHTADVVETVRAAVDEVRARAEKKALPPAHPDCERCKEQTRRATKAMRKRRGKS